MKQNNIFSYVKRNDNNSKGMDRNEQCECSLNVRAIFSEVDQIWFNLSS